jgi:hypothetical protein
LQRHDDSVNPFALEIILFYGRRTAAGGRAGFETASAKS